MRRVNEEVLCKGKITELNRLKQIKKRKVQLVRIAGSVQSAY
jgi:hypothetical protein